jgi:hypothetical protein
VAIDLDAEAGGLIGEGIDLEAVVLMQFVEGVHER